MNITQSLIFFTALIPALVAAQEPAQVLDHQHTEAIQLVDGYVRMPPPGSEIAVAYLTLRNQASETVTLTKMASPSANRVELHEHLMANGMMQMRHLEQHSIAGGSSLVMQPGGLHLMLIGLSQPLLNGNEVDVTLCFDTGFCNEARLRVSVDDGRVRD